MTPGDAYPWQRHTVAIGPEDDDYFARLKAAEEKVRRELTEALAAHAASQK